MNLKTPDEIKKGLECCTVEGEFRDCDNCTYLQDVGCQDITRNDALAYIQQLEAERDAAIENIRGDCVYCLHFCEDMVAPSCVDCANKGYYRWEWRGAQKEET